MGHGYKITTYSSHVNGCHFSSGNGTTICRFSPFSHHPPFSDRNGRIEQPDIADFAQPNTFLSNFLIQISLPNSQWHVKGRTRPTWAGKMIKLAKVSPFLVDFAGNIDRGGECKCMSWIGLGSG